MKYFLLITLFSISSCASFIIDKEEEYSCKNTCLESNKEYLGYDKKRGCFCG